MADSETHSKRTTVAGDENKSKVPTRTARHTTPMPRKTTLSSAVKGAPMSKSSEKKTSSTRHANEDVNSAIGAGVPDAPQPATETKLPSAVTSPRPSGLSQQSRNAIISASIIGMRMII